MKLWGLDNRWKFSKAGTFFWQVVRESVCKQIYHCFLFTTSTLNMIQFHICQTTICGIFPLFLKPLTNCLQCFLKQAFDRPALVLTAPVESKCVLSTSLTSSWQNCNLTKDFTLIISQHLVMTSKKGHLVWTFLKTR